MVKVDFELGGGGTVYTLLPITEAAQDWVAEHLPEDRHMIGNAVVIERGYIADVINGLVNDGLTIT